LTPNQQVCFFAHSSADLRRPRAPLSIRTAPAAAAPQQPRLQADDGSDGSGSARSDYSAAWPGACCAPRRTASAADIGGSTKWQAAACCACAGPALGPSPKTALPRSRLAATSKREPDEGMRPAALVSSSCCYGDGNAGEVLQVLLQQAEESSRRAAAAMAAAIEAEAAADAAAGRVAAFAASVSMGLPLAACAAASVPVSSPMPLLAATPVSAPPLAQAPVQLPLGGTAPPMCSYGLPESTGHAHALGAFPLASPAQLLIAPSALAPIDAAAQLPLWAALQAQAARPLQPQAGGGGALAGCGAPLFWANGGIVL
jgi:hypothetical protein